MYWINKLIIYFLILIDFFYNNHILYLMDKKIKLFINIYGIIFWFEFFFFIKYHDF